MAGEFCVEGGDEGGEAGFQYVVVVAAEGVFGYADGGWRGLT